jgi:hypothetical protein
VLSRRNERYISAKDVTETRALIGAKDKPMVSDDGCAGSGAELISLERVGLGSKEVARIHSPIAK